MTITTRAAKGAALTHVEMDANFEHLSDLEDNLASTDGFSLVGGGIVRAPASDSTSYPTHTNADASRGVKVGNWNYLRQVPAAAAAQIVPGFSSSTFVITTNCYYDAEDGIWRAMAGGQVGAFVFQDGSAWFCYTTASPGGADVAINANGGATPAWTIGSKFYSTPTGNFGVGRRFDATLNTGSSGGEPEGKLHLAADGNIKAIIESSDASNGSALEFRRSRGTNASLADVQNGDAIGAVVGYVFEGSAFIDTAEIGMFVDGTFTSGQRPPSRITVKTNTAGGSATERLRVRANGSIWTAANTIQQFDSSGKLTPAGGSAVERFIAESATLNFGAPGSVPGDVDLTMTVTGVVFGVDRVVGVTGPIAPPSGYSLSAFVSDDDEVTVRWTQYAGAAADPDGAGGIYRVIVVGA